MVAETAFNVIQSLPQEELNRLYLLLDVIPKNSPFKQKKKVKSEDTIWTIEFVTEHLLATHFKNKKR